MQLRDIAESKRDYFTFDPRRLKVDPAYNVRDLTTPDAMAKLEELKASIIENGVRVPLEVRLDGEDVFVVAGHRRLAATLTAIAEGHDIKAIPVIPEKKNMGHEERCLNLIISNDGEPLKDFEVAEVCRRLEAYGWEHQQIARRCGRKSSQWVKDKLALLTELAPDTKASVKAGEISASLALQVTRQEGEKAPETLKAAKEDAKSRGKKKVTKKAIDRVTKTKSNSTARGKEDALCDFASVADKAQSYAQMDGGTPSAEHTQEIVTALGAALEKAKGKGVKSPEKTPAPIPGGMNGHANKNLLKVLAPFAEYCEAIQDPETDPDGMIQIRAGYVFEAAAAYRAATGGES